MLKNIINSKNCLFYIFFDLKCRRASTHIFCICLVQNCLSQVKISETVCESVLVLKLSVLKRTSKRLFIHPCSHLSNWQKLSKLLQLSHFSKLSKILKLSNIKKNQITIFKNCQNVGQVMFSLIKCFKGHKSLRSLFVCQSVKYRESVTE